jgi:zinc D-Ala-D-Ala carboxypeptidase
MYNLKNVAVVLWVIGCLACTQNDGKTDTSKPGHVLSVEAKSTIDQVKPQGKMENQYTELLSVDFLMGKFKPEEHPDFAKIPTQIADKDGIYLHKDALQAFVDMHAAAKQDGIDLLIRSAARNFDYQKAIWEAKWTGARTLSGGINAAKDIKDPNKRATEILKYSSMPGASRHHWGTDIDLNAFDNAYFTSGKGQIEFDWLQANAAKYGYCRVYTAKGTDRTNGYEEEKWHWSYTPISKKLTSYARATMQDQVFGNFLGSETAVDLGIVANYVLGISTDCQE